LRPHSERGLILIDILIVILIAGIIAAIVIPQYAQKKKEEQKALSRQNMITLADAQDAYFKENGKFASSLEELSRVNPGLGEIAGPGNEEFIIELPDSLSYVITSLKGYGEIQADTTERKISWGK
jgi:type IV pilus assembly protein PilA